MELIIALFFLVFFLAIMTVVGHVIWLIIAAVLRWISKGDKEPPPPPSRRSRIFDAPPVFESRDDLAAFERQLVRFYTDGKINDEVYEQLIARFRLERAPKTAVRREPVQNVVVEPVIQSPVKESTAEPPPKTAPPPPRYEPPPPRPEPPPPPPRPPRRPFSEVLNSFMEESNIRWGEIIGGLLIIGCSTALVVSLWAQISQIPVLKFLIFTTVTAILF